MDKPVRTRSSISAALLLALALAAPALAASEEWALLARAPWQPEFGEAMCRENALEALHDRLFEAAARCRALDGRLSTGDPAVSAEAGAGCAAEQVVVCRHSGAPAARSAGSEFDTPGTLR